MLGESIPYVLTPAFSQVLGMARILMPSWCCQQRFSPCGYCHGPVVPAALSACVGSSLVGMVLSRAGLSDAKAPSFAWAFRADPPHLPRLILFPKTAIKVGLQNRAKGHVNMSALARHVLPHMCSAPNPLPFLQAKLRSWARHLGHGRFGNVKLDLRLVLSNQVEHIYLQ